MLLREVEYARPASVQDALRLLGANEGARALAGGQTLINVMKARAASPDVLVDLADIGELHGIELGSDGTLEIGAMTTYSELIDSAEAPARPTLREVCNQIADVQVRNRGTIGGNVCSNDPTNHLPPLLVAIGKDGTCIVNVAASVDGSAVRLAIGCVDAVPVLLTSESTEEDAVRAAVQGANLDPPWDVHASADYRRHLAEVLALRAVAQAAERK